MLKRATNVFSLFGFGCDENAIFLHPVTYRDREKRVRQFFWTQYAAKQSCLTSRAVCSRKSMARCSRPTSFTSITSLSHCVRDYRKHGGFDPFVPIFDQNQLCNTRMNVTFGCGELFPHFWAR